MNHILSDNDTEAVHEILVEQLGVQKTQLTPDARLQGDLGADSLDVVEISMAVEDRFNVSLPDESVENVSTVGDLQELLAGVLQKQA
jgi:acyl carrier protein